MLSSSRLLFLSLALFTSGNALPTDAAGLHTAASNGLSGLTPVEVDLRVLTGMWGESAVPPICAGQSCIVADLSGSTGNLPKFKPVGGDQNSYKCIAKYNPQGVEAVGKAPPVAKQNNGLSSALLGTLNTLQGSFGSKAPKAGTFKGKCAPNILIYAKGTTEPGELGITVGPALRSGLASKGFTVAGVNYPADIPGDYCLGLPGGMVARDMLNQAASKCPNARIFMAGYSQGAMVVRNAVAYAQPAARAKVVAVVTFGDPFQGAKIAKYKGKIITYCNNGDAICTGNFELRGSHLAYAGGPSKEAIAEIMRIAKPS